MVLDPRTFSDRNNLKVTDISTWMPKSYLHLKAREHFRGCPICSNGISV